MASGAGEAGARDENDADPPDPVGGFQTVTLGYRARATFVRGDVDLTGRLALDDAVLLLQSLFRGGGALPCEDAADANDDGGLNVTDGVYILAHLFLSGPAPPAPFPEAGRDATDDALGCVGR